MFFSLSLSLGLINRYVAMERRRARVCDWNAICVPARNVKRFMLIASVRAKRYFYRIKDN